MERAATTGSARPARRLVVRRWRDPRLLAGVVLVVGASAFGARVVAAADDTVPYWTVAEHVRAGDPVTADDLVAVDVQLAGASRDAYVRADDELPARLEDLRWTRGIAPGELVEATAWATGPESAGHLPVTVQTGFLPTDLRVGDVVDVWVGPGPGEDPSTDADRLITALRVIDPGESQTLGASVTRTVLLDLDDLVLTGDRVAALASGHVTLVRVP